MWSAAHARRDTELKCTVKDSKNSRRASRRECANQVKAVCPVGVPHEARGFKHSGFCFWERRYPRGRLRFRQMVVVQRSAETNGKSWPLSDSENGERGSSGLRNRRTEKLRLVNVRCYSS